MVERKDSAAYEAQATLVRSLACAPRLLIVHELADSGERSVQELTALMTLDTSTVSRHLSTLKSAGVVASRKVGTTVYYRLRMKCVPVFLNCVQSMLRENAGMRERPQGASEPFPQS